MVTKTETVFEQADEPVVVSQAMHHALARPYPRTRFLVRNANGTHSLLAADGGMLKCSYCRGYAGSRKVPREVRRRALK